MPPGVGEKIVVLRTGGVLRGHITLSGQQYIVSAEDREIRLLARDVEMVCRDLAEAYTKKRGAMFVDSSTEHIALAQWCIRHGQHESAARELLDARRLDPRHPRLAFTEQCLALAMHSVPTSVTKKHVVQQATRAEESQIKETKDVDTQAVDLPTTKVIESYTLTIQPLLLNTCTASGCHQVGGREAFQLDRWALGRTGGRRTTLRNLQATLAWVDRKKPLESRLLQEASRAHGQLAVPPLAGRRAELYVKLADWVQECRANLDPPTGNTTESVTE